MKWMVLIAFVLLCIFVGPYIMDELLTNGTEQMKWQESRALREISDDW